MIESLNPIRLTVLRLRNIILVEQKALTVVKTKCYKTCLSDF